MKEFKKAIKVKIDVYNRDLHVLFNYNPRESRNYINKKTNFSNKSKELFLKHFTDERQDGKGSCISDGIDSFIILGDYRDIPDLVNTISHEAFHFVFTVLDHAGLKLSYKSEEAYTYLIGYVVEEIYRGIVEPLITFNSKIQN